MLYLLLDIERTIDFGKYYYWKGNKYGYTPNLKEAGIFTKEEAEKICNEDLKQNTAMIPVNKNNFVWMGA